MTTNPRQDLEREASIDHACSLAFHETARQKFGRGTLTPEYAQGWFRYGYLAAATAREKEVEELRAFLERANKAATANVPWMAMLHLFRLVANVQISARKAFELAQALVHGGIDAASLPYLNAGKPMTGEDNRDSEIASLRAKIEAVPVEEIRAVVDALTDRFEDSETSDCCDAIDRWLAGLGK